jgi:YHS domain-containing protein
MAKDPICDTEVDEQAAQFKSEYGSQTYYFCSEGCDVRNNLNLDQNSMRVRHKSREEPYRIIFTESLGKL